jgi:hypothetical protein
MSCHGRGVECEGYPLRWVAARTDQPVSVRKQQASVRLVSKNEMPATLRPPDGLQVFIKYCKDASLW